MYVGAENIDKRRPCEGCGLKRSSFGLPSEGKVRWCSGCGKGHAGAFYLVSKKCEGCHLKQPKFGLPAERTARWCMGCAKGHEGVVNVGNNKCEGCDDKFARFGLPSDWKKRRWCGDCAPRMALLQKKPKVTDPPLTILDL
jgi:hypothetical protein